MMSVQPKAGRAHEEQTEKPGLACVTCQGAEGSQQVNTHFPRLALKCQWLH